ncbi:MAG: diphthine--ammonia ligase, partial [Candidatus Omnitrophica bacterium]|nr:diphthine--ammonia ligase [Candidatus Omnitrophota bacterium]
MKVISLWSGGKDSCFACYKAQKSGHEVCGLINFTAAGGKNSLSHGLPAELVLKQARLTGIPVFQKAMPKENYREAFKAIIGGWKREKGIEGVVFGDIYLTEHKDWIDKVCAEIGIEPLIPLWEEDTAALINEFIDLGFETTIVTVKSGVLDK